MKIKKRTAAWLLAGYLAVMLGLAGALAWAIVA